MLSCSTEIKNLHGGAGLTAQANQRDMKTLQEVADRYPDTLLGAEVAKTLADQAFDHQEANHLTHLVLDEITPFEKRM
jgi:hypothetical protein